MWNLGPPVSWQDTKGPLAGFGQAVSSLWSLTDFPGEYVNTCSGKIRPAWRSTPAAPVSLLAQGAKKPPDNLSPSDASITMAAPQLQEALHQLQQIIIRGTMKCPRHWQLICLWQSNISTREITPCVASQAEAGRNVHAYVCAGGGEKC